jgi:hypothetical protein
MEWCEGFLGDRQRCCSWCPGVCALNIMGMPLVIITDMAV